jgi:hypothetical protein
MLQLLEYVKVPFKKRGRLEGKKIGHPSPIDQEQVSSILPVFFFHLLSREENVWIIPLIVSAQTNISIPRPPIQVDHIDLLMCQNTVDHPESTHYEVSQNQAEEEWDGALIPPNFAILQNDRF